MKIKSSADFRRNFQDVIDHVHYTKVPVIISKNRKPWVMVQTLPDDATQLQQLLKNVTAQTSET
jgi:prevent-host-death family protein